MMIISNRSRGSTFISCKTYSWSSFPWFKKVQVPNDQKENCLIGYSLKFYSYYLLYYLKLSYGKLEEEQCLRWSETQVYHEKIGWRGNKHVFLIHLQCSTTFKHMVLFVCFYLNGAPNIQLLRSLMAFESSCTWIQPLQSLFLHPRHCIWAFWPFWALQELGIVHLVEPKVTCHLPFYKIK